MPCTVWCKQSAPLTSSLPTPVATLQCFWICSYSFTQYKTLPGWNFLISIPHSYSSLFPSTFHCCMASEALLIWINVNAASLQPYDFSAVLQNQNHCFLSQNRPGRKMFTEIATYTKLQSNIEVINWIQDQYMNPNQLLSLGINWLLLLPYALPLGFEEWQWEHSTEVVFSNHHLSLGFPFTNHGFISGVAAPRVQEHNM